MKSTKLTKITPEKSAVPAEMEAITLDLVSATVDDVIRVVEVIVKRAAEGKKTFLWTEGNEEEHEVISGVGFDTNIVYKEIDAYLRSNGDFTISPTPPPPPKKEV